MSQLAIDFELIDANSKGLPSQWTRPDPKAKYVPCDRYGRPLQQEQRKEDKPKQKK